MQITIYVDSNVRFGRDTVEGLRISPQAPVSKQLEIQPNTKAWENAVVAYKRDGNFEAVLKRVGISEENQKIMIEEAASVS
jgi:hypothetical protein